MVTVLILPDGKRVEVSYGARLYDILVSAGIEFTSTCGGRGLCGRCRIRVLSGAVSGVTSIELRYLSREEIDRGMRLACQVKVLGDVIVYVPEYVRARRPKLAIFGIEPSIVLEPAIVVRRIEVLGLRPSADFLENLSLKDVDIDLYLLRSAGFRDVVRRCMNSCSLIAVLYRYCRSEVIDFILGNVDAVYGIAVDVGTSKIVCYLVDLIKGCVISIASASNPQAVYGEDIFSRITFAMSSYENLRRLRDVVVKCINELIEELCRRCGVDSCRIYEVVAVGNPTMHHLFYGIEVYTIGRYPYIPITRSEILVKARDLGLNINPCGYVYSPPFVSSFLGSDAVAAVLALELHRRKGTYLLIDIGTNTEIVLVHEGELIACSAPSGPAFEGGHIRFGMRAVEGAIDSVKIGDDYTVTYTTVGGTKPRGICGSGIIDLVAELLRVGIIDTSGRFRLDVPTSRVRTGEDGIEFVVAYAHETDVGKDIVITQRDVREIQKAKAAIRSGISVILRELGIDEKSIDKIYLAGSFGTYLRSESAITIGLLPEVPSERIEFVGNAAGSGAVALLKSVKLREEARDLVRRIRYVELSTHPLFKEEFIRTLYLPHADPSLYPITFSRIKAPKVLPKLR